MVLSLEAVEFDFKDKTLCPIMETESKSVTIDSVLPSVVMKISKRILLLHTGRHEPLTYLRGFFLQLWIQDVLHSIIKRVQIRVFLSCFHHPWQFGKETMPKQTSEHAIQVTINRCGCFRAKQKVLCIPQGNTERGQILLSLLNYICFRHASNSLSMQILVHRLHCHGIYNINNHRWHCMFQFRTKHSSTFCIVEHKMGGDLVTIGKIKHRKEK